MLTKLFSYPVVKWTLAGLGLKAAFGVAVLTLGFWGAVGKSLAIGWFLLKFVVFPVAVVGAVTCGLLYLYKQVTEGGSRG